MIKNCFMLISIIAAAFLHAQPSIQWQKCLGGTTGDWAQSIQPTIDSGYIVAGYTMSNNNDVSGNNGMEDFWVTKLNASGNLQWQTCLGGSDYEEAYSIRHTSDSGYIVAGFTTSNDSDVTGFHGGEDYWIVKLSQAGSIQWQTCLGGTGFDAAFSVAETGDGGFVAVGAAQSNDGDVSGNHGGYDSWIVKLDAGGALQWQKCLGGSGDDIASGVQATADGGYIVIGSTLSNDGDVTGNHGDWDYWVTKLNNAGALQWQHCYGGSAQDIGYAIAAVDSGYVVTGFTLSNDNDVTGLHGTNPDCWLIQLDTSGALQWQKCLGGSADDKSYAVVRTADGGCAIAGYTTSNDGDVSGNHSGAQDYWLVKVDTTGAIEWQKCLGGLMNDWARSVHTTADTGYVVAGFSGSNNGDVSGNHGNNDFWVVKLHASAVGIEEKQQANSFSLFPNPSEGVFTIQSRPGTRLSIMNALGKTVFETVTTTDQTEIDLSSFAAGVYLVRVGEQPVEKVIVR